MCPQSRATRSTPKATPFSTPSTPPRPPISAISEATAGLDGGPIRIRVGIHTGHPELDPPNYVGIDIHRAARIMSAAHGGQVILSATTAELLDGTAELKDLGNHHFKDFDAPERVYQLGEASFPPLKTLYRSNLPVPATPFLGREQELTQVTALLIDPSTRLLTLTGPGGTGKTRLALRAAEEVAPAFPDGVYWVELAALRQPDLVLSTIAHTLEARRELAEHIGSRRLLVLLDNFEQVVGAAAELGQLLSACPNVTLLVTSRELLNIKAEVTYEVRELTGREAVFLFCARARLEASEEIATLCARLDNLPLAVELAAGRTRALSPAQILDRLSQRLDLLKGARDADPRQQTLRATIEWSYDLLSETEQQLYRRLSVFAGGCAIEAAEDVADADVDILQALVEKSLLRFVDGRYSMLETIREYAAERLRDSSDAETLRHRHALWFARLLEASEETLEGSGQDALLDLLEREHDNVRAALRWALDDSQDDLALRLAAASAAFWWVRGYWNEGRRWLEAALEQSTAHDETLRAKALVGAANLAARQGDYDRAAVLADEGLAICRTLDDGSGVARAFRVLALVAFGTGDRARYRALVEQSADSARESGDTWALSMALNNLGNDALDSGDLEGAAKALDEAVGLARGRGDQRSESFFLESLALAKLEQGLAGEARVALLRSLDLAHRLGYAEVLADTLIGIAAMATTTDDYGTAARLVAGAGAIRERIGGALDPVEARFEAQVLTAVEEHLDPESRAAASRAGREMSLDELVELARSLTH